MHLNHPENNCPTLSPWKKFSSTKLVPEAKKFGDCCPKIFTIFSRVLEFYTNGIIL